LSGGGFMDSFTKEIKRYLEKRFGNSIEDASERQIYQALMVITRDKLAGKRYHYINKLKESEQKRVYYMSMEFLVGKTLRNNLYNLGIESEVKNFLSENGFVLDKIYD